MKINDLLCWQVRDKVGRAEDPSLVVIDTQSVHAAVNVPAATTGKDAAKKVPGRKRGLVVDVLRLVIAVTVLAASADDNAFGIALLGQVAPIGTIEKALVDQGFMKTVAERGSTVGIDVEAERNPSGKGSGFVPQAKRWIVEQTLGILMLFRRLMRDCESKPKSSEYRVRRAVIDVIARRLTGQTTPSWRG
ncbi:transposase [Streptomyces sp. NPDC051172]|uniref:transposase n=1 Tax=Streptomyces sp. NPDC051172 TaxID=3155796 RepID=UPI0034262981